MSITDVLSAVFAAAVLAPVLWAERRVQNRLVSLIESRRDRS